MPRETVVVQVGQCGNQIGWQFWNELLAERSAATSASLQHLSPFFEIESHAPDTNAGGLSLRHLRARAVLVDMEEGVLAQLLKGKHAPLFQHCSLVKDSPGSGNNWAHGHFEHWSVHGSSLEGQVRRSLESCDSPGNLLFLHSLSGGTGSGLGTRLLAQCADAFSDIDRIAAVVAPDSFAPPSRASCAHDSDVVTAPYNAVLALEQLQQHASLVIPFTNAAMNTIAGGTDLSAAEEPRPAGKSKALTAFETANRVAAQALVDIAAGSRFGGPLHLDLGELPTNLVPLPSLPFASCSVSPFVGDVGQRGKQVQAAGAGAGAGAGARPRVRDRSMPRAAAEMLRAAAHPSQHGIETDPRARGTLALALLARSAPEAAAAAGGRGLAAGSRSRRSVPVPSFSVSSGDLQRCVQDWRAAGHVRMPWYCSGGKAVKTALCSVPGASGGPSTVALWNNAGMGPCLGALARQAGQLLRVRAHLHHYEDLWGDALAGVQMAMESLLGAEGDYEAVAGHADGLGSDGAHIGAEGGGEHIAREWSLGCWADALGAGPAGAVRGSAGTAGRITLRGEVGVRAVLEALGKGQTGGGGSREVRRLMVGAGAPGAVGVVRELTRNHYRSGAPGSASRKQDGGDASQSRSAATAASPPSQLAGAAGQELQDWRGVVDARLGIPVDARAKSAKVHPRGSQRPRPESPVDASAGAIWVDG